MKTVEIDGQNVAVYEELLGYAAENIGREWCRAIVVMNDTEDVPYAGILWELIGIDDEEETTAEILWCEIWNPEAESLLFSEYKKRIQEENVQSTSFELPVEEAGSAREAFEREGFAPEEGEGQIIAITLRDATELPFIKKSSLPYYVSSLSDHTERSLRRGIANCMYHGARGMLYDQATIPTEWFNLDVSTCVETDGRISGLFLIHETTDGALIPQLLCAYGPDYQKELMWMICCAVQSAGMSYPSGTKVLLSRHDERTRVLIGKLFPGRTGIPVLKGMRREA